MDLMKFKGVDNAVKMTIRLSIGYCVVLTIAFYHMHHLSDYEAGKSLQPGIGHRQEWRSI